MSGTPRNCGYVVALFVLVSYIWISVFGLFQATHMSHTAQGMHPCPFMVGQQAICPMDTVRHLQAWQAFSMVVFPIVEALLLAICFFISIQLWVLSPPRRISLRQRYKTAPALLYQQLFSEGILHPKVP